MKRNAVILSRARLLFCGFALLLLPVPWFLAVGQAAAEDRVASIMSSILALDSARKTVVEELASLPAASPERIDSLDFIAYLNTRIGSYCKQLYQAGALVELERLPCPAAARYGGRPAGADPPSASAPALTRAERTARLDEKLLDALGEFDEMLTKEEAKIASRTPKRRESGGAGGRRPAADSTGQQAAGERQATASVSERQEGAGGTDSTSAGGGRTATATEDASAESQGPVVSPGKPGFGGGRKLPPPEDDDIVARQLREAAQKEPDPELQRKLWEEYWKYKGGVKSD
ncbi:hypothetical protein C2E25_05490 [Geothermobacter hydrogeniphilus]|uniref:Uncharacterized protein n=1 Tax=Geothermobacter hydrogeniphilus TaxID=1969733 RepID=A0A2K2HBY9_9BACT|nr:hypothetical protein [Geothermobacter hydrogeniphilus]PNU20838.1 hypothetical protein C2E25_05490 [Geothermobacter hydrogeniphilus]